MHKTIRKAMLAAAALALAAAGCAESHDYAIPKDACGVPIDSALLSPLLPPGKKLTQDKYDAGAESPRCRLAVDTDRVVYLNGDVIPTDTDPIKLDPRGMQRMGHPSAVSLGDGAQVADWGAIAFADCTYQGKKQRFVALVQLEKPVPEKVSERRDALVSFLRAYLPAAMKAQGCTRP
ncbi:hypothetical protein [Streptomyces violascens]|uniref:hypothetical protein n=1 Tax=Streptomyces violascens TaxID=67381 RepID=UPI0036906D2D